MFRLEEHKQATEHKAIEKMPLPSKVYLPLVQHIGKPCSSLQVKAGDTVLTGQKVAVAQANVYAPIHVSVSGKVASVQEWPHPAIGRYKAVVIEGDGRDALFISQYSFPGAIEKLSADQIRNIVFEAGIVGMGGATFPTHIKLNPPKPVDTLIINGAECEPYLNADNRLMIEKAPEILKGIGLIVKCLGVKSAYIAIEDNKPEAIKAFEDSVLGTGYELRVLKSSYPQGGEKQLINNVLGRQVPSGKLPFDIGVVVQNVATVFAAFEAVYLNKPLYERVVTVTGSCLSNPRNLLVRLGTPIKDLIDYCGPLKEEPAKVVVGGPMMGVAQYSLDAPVIKSTNGIVLLAGKEVKLCDEDNCIRCAACVRECPAGLMPCLINLASEKGLWKEAAGYGAADCIECGLCNYVCPAGRRLVQSIKRAKLELQRQ